MKLENLRWMLKKIKTIPFLISLAITFGAALISVLIVGGGYSDYAALEKPAFAPPGWVFPVVWTILYALMAVAAYLVSISCSPGRQEALKLYIVQLIVNVIWPVIFFKMDAYLLAFTWLLLLWYLVFTMLQKFHDINKTAGKLIIPYLIWITFAGCLNLAIIVSSLK